MLAELNGHGDVGKSFLSETCFLVHYPTINDMLLLPDESPSIYTTYDTIPAVYDTTQNPPVLVAPSALSQSGIDSYRRAVCITYPQLLAANHVSNNSVASFLQHSLAPDVLSNLKKNPKFSMLSNGTRPLMHLLC